MDLSVVVGAAEEIDLAGAEYSVRLLTLREWGEISAWLKRRSPSPVTRAGRAIDQAAADGEPLSIETREILLDHAQRAALSWPPRLGSTDWFESIDRADGGQAYLLHQVLSKADKTFTIERATALAKLFSTDDWNELLRVSFYGQPPRPAPKVAAAEEAA